MGYCYLTVSSLAAIITMPFYVIAESQYGSLLVLLTPDSDDFALINSGKKVAQFKTWKVAKNRARSLKPIGFKCRAVDADEFDRLKIQRALS